MTNYTSSEMSINQAFCKAFSRRLLIYNAVLKPARHSIAWVNVRSPIIELIFNEVHHKMHCGLGLQSYINRVNLARFCAAGIKEYVKDQINDCPTCIEVKMIIGCINTHQKYKAIL